MRLVAALLALGVLVGSPAVAGADDAVWALLKGGGQVIMLRHATAPGAYDPPGMRLDDCSTQRNLSEAGRDEARRIGAAFRAQGVPVIKVMSSRWCRCLDTARLAFGRVEHWWALDGARPGTAEEASRTAEVRALVSQPFTGGNVVLVSHGFNIRALTGLSPLSGEMIVLTPAGNNTFTIAGRIPPSDLPSGP